VVGQPAGRAAEQIARQQREYRQQGVLKGLKRALHSAMMSATSAILPMAADRFSIAVAAIINGKFLPVIASR